ncbi:MAG TPA: D-alanyl-D-alanine carboxypeptidase, partial [Chitinophagaceae bacterium]|nr:D-alanyl-D-alanine carboxypeptidase [Chitinophagaceae bacterium]
GKDFRYKTEFGINEKPDSRLYIFPSGDPTFGSWRWSSVSNDTLFKNLKNGLIKKEIQKIAKVIIDNSGWDAESIPDGWIWQDIGNYYGAGAQKLNYRENQLDILLQSGKSIGDSVRIISLIPEEALPLKEKLVSKLTAAARGSGDNAYVYYPNDGTGNYLIRGSIPVNESSFSISASMTAPAKIFFNSLNTWLQKEKQIDGSNNSLEILNKPLIGKDQITVLYTHISPSLDSIIYWFNKKSVNLIGEALLKTIGYLKKGIGSTDSGVVVVKDFWKEKKLVPDELKIVDGSGLSPLNRVTTHAQVEILKYARSREWFPGFYNSLPEYNGMMMKSGTIRGVKGFAGYHKAKNGKEYIFSFLVNNYNGSPAALVNKMYRVLNNLK